MRALHDYWLALLIPLITFGFVAVCVAAGIR